MPERFQERLRAAGLAHVVVASGFALSVIINFAKKYLGKISRFATLVGSTLLIFGFIAVAGFTPSLLRAGIASLAVLAFGYFGRRLHPARLLIYVAALSFTVSPPHFFNVAWQLSFASYAGIIMILPLVQYFFYADRQPNYFASAVLVSLSAQLACLPLSLYYFGGFAILGAISNLIVPPLIPAVMLLSFIVSLGIKFPPLVFILRIMLKIQVHATEFIGGIPWAMLEVESGRPIYFALYPFILVLLLVVYRLIKHDYRPSYMARGAPQDMVKYIYEN